MAFNFDPSLPTPKDKVRALIRDVKPDRAVFDDGEILGFLTLEDPTGQDVLTGAAYACLALAADKARLALVAHDGGESNIDSLALRYQQQADKYFERATAGAGFAVIEMPGAFPAWPPKIDPTGDPSCSG